MDAIAGLLAADESLDILRDAAAAAAANADAASSKLDPRS